MHEKRARTLLGWQNRHEGKKINQPIFSHLPPQAQRLWPGQTLQFLQQSQL